MSRVERRVRLALVLVIVGLCVQLVATFHWSPATFILSAAIGVPLVVLGAAFFGWAVLRARGAVPDTHDKGGAE